MLLGITLGRLLGGAVGIPVGPTVGSPVGIDVGSSVGTPVGESLGLLQVGLNVGVYENDSDETEGSVVGSNEGE